MKLTDKQKNYFNNLQPFKNLWDIPNLPIVDDDDYYEYIVPNLIRCGAIPKKDLVINETYKGSCRNSDTATWDGEKFTYMRTKWGATFPETIRHFEENSNYDVFIPINLECKQ